MFLTRKSPVYLVYFIVVILCNVGKILPLKEMHKIMNVPISPMLTLKIYLFLKCIGL
jgi:hypothetical protein